MTDPTNYLHRRFSYPWLAHAVRERGIPATLRAVPAFASKLWRSWWWDHRHRVSTRGRVFGGRLAMSGPSAAHARAYEAADTTVLPRVLQELNIRHDDYAFVDLGAGKARALFLASELPFKRIVGVELSRTLWEAGLENCRTFRSEQQLCGNIELICGDAAEYVFPPEPLVIFLFNSFDEFVLSRVLANLGRSVDEHPRDVLLIYLNPQHRDLIESTGVFERIVAGTDERDYRKLGYDVFRRIRGRHATAAQATSAPQGQSGGA